MMIAASTGGLGSMIAPLVVGAVALKQYCLKDDHVEE